MTSKAPRRRSSGFGFLASSTIKEAEPTVTPPHRRWEKDYINDLRTNRPARPSGSRPAPGRASTAMIDPFVRATSALSSRPPLSTQQAAFTGEGKDRSASALSHRRAQSDMPTKDSLRLKPGSKFTLGRRSTRDFSQSSQDNKATPVAPCETYRENGMRWMERQEARSLREALEDMDLKDEAKILAAAQDEATELVRQHREGEPDRAWSRQRTYKDHLQKGAHARSQSQALNGLSAEARISDSRRISGQSLSTGLNALAAQDRSGATTPTIVPGIEEPRSHMEWDSPQKKSYMSLAFPFELRKPPGRRRSSGPRARDFSGGLFRNPDDKIYEEPSENIKEMKSADPIQTSKIPLAVKARNTVSKIQTASQPFLRSRQSSAEEKRPPYRSEIPKDPPSQSRDPSYTTNRISPNQQKGDSGHGDGELRERKAQDMEIRSDDIKAATSMRMKDRSPKLPSPTVVGNRPTRPIVSFARDWRTTKPNDSEDVGRSQPSGIAPAIRHKPQMLESTTSAPAIPTINVREPIQTYANRADDVFGRDTAVIPTIAVSEVSIPTISLPDDTGSARPLPDPSSRPRPVPANRPLPHHSSTAPVPVSVPHWSASQQRATAQCAACALPIAGRIVSAAAQRFHPHCFTCHNCTEPLECVAFYREPDSKREERIARIEARAQGIEPLEEKPGETASDDSDTSLRFYCHLDFHEFFSPRCKSCKTPIESEVVVACGSTWHVGHFFCAECGDPFDPQTPFVEKNGYAWCVNCHACKFNGKCKGCRKPVVTEGIRALDADWHGGCFVCSVSHRYLKKSQAVKLMQWFQGMQRSFRGRAILHSRCGSPNARVRML